MTNQEIFSHIDHTLLRADSSLSEIFTLCEEALAYGAASVCIPPSYVKTARENYPGLRIGTVIGFPLGYAVTEVKRAELLQADRDGAEEFDVVIHLGDVKSGLFDKVEEELCTMRKTTGMKTLKVIVETCSLTQEEKLTLCEIVTRIKADYIKTSTGFGRGGAQMADILLFREHIGPEVKIKASGGIRTRETMEAFILAGCDRVGTSSAMNVLVRS